MKRLEQRLISLFSTIVLMVGIFGIYPQMVGAITCVYGADNGSGQCVGLLISGSSWTVPSDWTDVNKIEAVGGGGGGAGGNRTTSAGKAGGGGGAYSAIVNLTGLSGSITYGIGAAGTAGTEAGAGGDGSGTWFNAASFAGCTSNTTCTKADFGRGGSGVTAGVGGATANGIGTGGYLYAGGVGGTGNTVTGAGGGGGGGAGGPLGTGGKGANAPATGGWAGGGGGGNGGGYAGSIGTAANTGGDGGNNYGNTGGGTGGTTNGNAGTSGGGGEGAAGRASNSAGYVGGAGSKGTEWSAGITHGTGGGAGGGGGNTTRSGGVAGATVANTGAGGGGGGGSGSTSYAGGVGTAGATGFIVITYTPKYTTTLSAGANPSANTVAPGSGLVLAANFTFTATSYGTDTINSLVVLLNGSGSPAGYLAASNVQIRATDCSGTQYFTSVAPSSDTVTFDTGTGLPVTTGGNAYAICITPKDHTLAAGTYTVSPTIQASTWTSANNNTKAGSDTNTNALAVDNTAPNGATSVSGSAGDTANTINWTSSNSSDFKTTGGSVVLRWASASAGGEVPAEGNTSYTDGNTISTATVACVISSAVSTALSKIDGTGGSAGCTQTALTNGQAYTYKVFQVDSYGNYDAGVSIGTFTPAIVSVDTTPPRRIRLFEGFKIKFVGGKTILYQQ